MADVGGAASLVVDDGDLVALRAEPEHRADEVVPGRAEEPGGADDPCLVAGRGLAEEFRPPVGAERTIAWTRGRGVAGVDLEVSPAQQGQSVALSADGNIAVVGGHADDSVGAVWVFTRLTRVTALA